MMSVKSDSYVVFQLQANEEHNSYINNDIALQIYRIASITMMTIGLGFLRTKLSSTLSLSKIEL